MTINSLSLKQQNDILSIVQDIKDTNLREVLNEFLKQKNLYENYSLDSISKVTKMVYVTKQFLLSILNSEIKLMNLNWQSYCVHMKWINDNTRIDEKAKTRNFLFKFYHFVLNNSSNEKLKKELNSCIDFLLPYESMNSNDKKEKIKDMGNIRTNFPLNSKVERLYQLYNSNSNYCLNFNLNSNNLLSLELLKGFLEYLNEILPFEKVTSTYCRLFLYYFEDSLGMDLSKIEDLNFDTFKNQYFFFKKLLDDKRIVEINPFLVKFYLFLEQYYFEKNGEKLFKSISFNTSLLTNSWFTRYIEEGYYPIYRSFHEELPKENKLLVIRKDSSKKANSNHSNVQLDFNKIKNENLRNEIKQYLWFAARDDKTIRDELRILTEFVNEAIEQFKNNKNVVSIYKDKKIFSNEFILKYIAKIHSLENTKGEKLSPRSVNNILSCIRKFLKSIKNNYQINELIINQIRLNPKTEENDGNPMTKEDFNVVAEEFKKRVKTNINGELFYIIFRLSLTTKLREGEILNLKRNCIVSKNENYGVIQYVSKTSNGELIEESFLKEDISLIEKAIKLTDSCRKKAPENLKGYIFIKFREKSYTNEVNMVSASYGRYFNDIVKELYEKGEIINIYQPYDARHTYINSVWESVEDNLLSTFEVQSVTGNTPEVAARHYRKQTTKRYIEATYMINIGDVNVLGEVVENEQIIEELPIVEQGAGVCKSDSCIKVDIEDTQYACLTCSKFATSTNRVEIFEKRLKKYKQQEEEALNPIEKDYYQSLVVLYASYLTKLYDLMEEKKKWNN